MDIDINELLYTALRASFVYFFLLLVVRVLEPVMHFTKLERWF